MKAIENRIAVLEQTLEESRPSGMTVTLTNGRQIVTDGGGAVDLVKQGGVAMVESAHAGNG